MKQRSMESRDLNFTTQNPSLSSLEVVSEIEALFPYQMESCLDFME